MPISTLRPLTRKEIDIPVQKEQKHQYVTNIIAWLETAAMTGNFPGYHATTVYERYADNEEGQEGMADDPP